MYAPRVRAGRIKRPTLPSPRATPPYKRRQRLRWGPGLGRLRQYGFPSADSADGNWVNQAGSNVNLYQSIDELPPGQNIDDTDFIRSEILPNNSGVRIKLTALADPASSVQHEIHWRPGKDLTGGPQVNMTVTLRQGGGTTLGGGTQIATFTRNNVDAFTTYIEQLSGVEADSITDYSDLYLEFYATQV